jgi:type VI secretion system secreted protein Hcp
MALDAFLQFNNKGNKGEGAPDVEGETQDVVMKKLKPPPFDLQSWSFGASQQVNVGSSSQGIGTGKVEFQPFKVTKQVDKSSPAFFKTCAQGGHFPECSLFVRKGGGRDSASGTIYLRFDFKMVFVTEIGWSHDDTAPKEEITFDYGALQMSYTRQKSTGGPMSEIKTGDSGSPGGEQNAAWSKMLNNNKFEVPTS